MNHDELGELLEALRDGTIDDAQTARLDQILAEEPEALDYFVDRALLQADLAFKLGRQPSMPAVPRRRRPSWKPLLALASAAAVVAAALLAIPTKQQESPSYEGCAVLTRALDVTWGDSAPSIGSVLPKRRLTLLSGSIQVEFFSGARVVVEGPADFELVSTNEAFCHHGKLRAVVPPQAKGFTIGASGLKLVDRGTEFGLRLPRGGDAEVHVFQGLVELQSKGVSRDLGGGNAVTLDSAGAIRPIPADTEGFLTISELNFRSAEEGRGRYARWESASERLRQDPRVAVYYSFEDSPSWSRELRCQRPERSPVDGAIIGARWTDGRWAGKKALEFKTPGDRVRFQDAGEYESLTLMTWVRVDGLDRAFSGLMLTDGWTSGSVHWQITKTGKLRLGIHGDGTVSNDYDTDPMFPASNLGRWINLCTVYDRQAREVVHYVDGRVTRRLPLKFDTALRLGNVELGNWGSPIDGSHYGIRHLNGRMDEFVIFGQALKEADVRELYQVGAPAP
jgi:hypothetical protein